MKYKLLLFPLQSNRNPLRTSFGMRQYAACRSIFQKNSLHNVNASHFHTSNAVLERTNHSTPIPRLMNSLDMKIVKPSLLKLITNQISARFIITPYFDNEFNIPEFKIGAKQAIVAVSSALACGNTASLEVLLTFPDFCRHIFFYYIISIFRMQLRKKL